MSGGQEAEVSLKVDNLPPGTQPAQLREAFEPYGEVTDAHIPRDRNFGFVRFSNPMEAEAAKEAMDGGDIGGRTVRVFVARGKDGDGEKRRADDWGGAPPAKRNKADIGPHCFKILCSDHVVSALIGKGGATMAEIQETTGASLDFSSRGSYFPSTRCRSLTIRAENPESVARVIDLVVDSVKEAAENLSDEACKGKFPGDCRVVALVARFAAGSLIGRGGEDMRKLQAEMQCYIEVEKTSLVEGHQRVEVRGDAEEVKRALAVVNDKVQAEVRRDWFPAWAAQDPLGGAGGGNRGQQSQNRQRPQQQQQQQQQLVQQVQQQQAMPPPAAYDEDHPTVEEMEQFRSRFPVDSEAWEFFIAATGPIQKKVILDFRPRPLRQGDQDYSAPLTSFVASVAKRFTENPSGFRKGLWEEEQSKRPMQAPFATPAPQQVQAPRFEMAQRVMKEASPAPIMGSNDDGPTSAELAAFRSQYPVDNRAWEFFCGSSGAIQKKVLGDFRPRPLRKEDVDYSALLTSFVASVSKRITDSGARPGTARTWEADARAGEGNGMKMEPREPGDGSAIVKTISEMPKQYLGFDYAISCDLPTDRCTPLERCMEEVAEHTRTLIEFHQSTAAEDMRRLSITGNLPDVYDAHLRLMWAFNEGEEEPQPSRDGDLERMQKQIADLQAQLQAVHTGGGRKGGGKGKGR